jgi:hypothetical protein
MRQLLAVMIRWFPQRIFVFAGDGGFGTHELSRFAHRHGSRLTLVSRFYPTQCQLVCAAAGSRQEERSSAQEGSQAARASGYREALG